MQYNLLCSVHYLATPLGSTYQELDAILMVFPEQGADAIIGKEHLALAALLLADLEYARVYRRTQHSEEPVLISSCKQESLWWK